MYADKWFEIIGWIPTVVLNKPMAMERVAHLNYKPGEGLFADQFKLMAVYGDVALATDRRIRKIADAHGNIVSTPHRALLVFVKQGGQWKVAADAAAPTIAAGEGRVTNLAGRRVGANSSEGRLVVVEQKGPASEEAGYSTVARVFRP